MPREKNNIKDILKSYKFDFNLLQQIPCSDSDNKMYKKMLKDGQQLPKGVFHYKNAAGVEINEFYTIYEPDLTQDEINEYLTYKKLSFIKTIKNCAVFFTTLTVISLIIYVVMLLASM